MRFTEFISEAGSPAQQAAIAIAMKKAGKKPKGVAEGAPELLKAEMPMVRHIENELATKGYKKGTEEYKKMFGHALAYYRKFGFPNYRKGVAEGEYQHKYGHEFKDFKTALEKKHGQDNVKIVGDGNVADAYHVKTGKHLGFIDGSHAEVNEQGVAENNTAAGINKMFNNLGDPVFSNLQRIALLAMQGRQQEASGRLQSVIKDASPTVQKKIIDAVNSIKPVTINGKIADSSTIDKSKQHQDWIINTFIPWVQSLLGQQGVAEGSDQITEYRDRLLQYVKSLLPSWPEYVLKDWLVPNKGDFSNLPADALKNSVMEKVQGAGLTANSKWQLVPNMKFTMDMFDPMTKQRLIGRAGGTSDLGMGIPKDKERHATQAALAQQQGGVRKEPVLLIKTAKGYELLEGWHRTIQHFVKYPEGYTGPAYVAVAVAQGQQGVAEEWSQKYKKSINCSHPKGFSQKAHCAGKKKHNESIDNVMEMTCPDCGMCQSHGDNSKDKLDELKCWTGFHRVKGTKAGFPGSCAKNKTNEEQVLENLHKWFKEKWVRFGPDGKIRGDCARGSESEGKPKCLPQSKAHSLGKKGRASAASRKRREDPNANRSGKAINVSTKGKGK
jgi:hypothetical protein